MAGSNFDSYGDELLKTLRDHFSPRNNKQAEQRYIFNKAAQQSGETRDETINEFIVRLKSLAQTCRFGEFKRKVKVAEKSTNGKETEVTVDEVISNYKTLSLYDALIDQFIVGINNSKIRQRLLSEDDLTFDECCLLATNMELWQK